MANRELDFTSAPTGDYYNVLRIANVTLYETHDYTLFASVGPSRNPKAYAILTHEDLVELHAQLTTYLAETE